jgi:DNA helicase HerA-like ATPase
MTTAPKPERLGVVTQGAFNLGLTVRLDPSTSTERLRIGSFVVVEGEQHRYFSLISDMSLQAVDPRIAADPPRDASDFIRGVLVGTATYATVEVKPQLMLDMRQVGAAERAGPQPVRTIPMHFAALREAGEMDFHTVFGEPDDRHFAMGTPLTMDIPICLDLEKWTQRSNGIFGQSGTGKSFLARLMLCGVIKSRIASNLIFDMHDEYAFGKESEEGKFVKGLRDIFGAHVRVYSLDEASARRPGRSVDQVLKIGLNQIEPEDILLLAEELNLRATAESSIGLLQDRFKGGWLVRLIEMSVEDLSEFCKQANASEAALGALQRNLKRIARQEYISPHAEFSQIDEMMGIFEQKGHVILQYGKFNSLLDYMLVANVITRRVRESYVKQAGQYEQSHDKADEPHPLVITIEEAHKFLNPGVARQTIFGTIARELRKYRVTLMVIDQRPSGIDSEIMSQLGTRVTGKLTDERDIESVFTGAGGRSFLRGALESLDTRQEVLLLGHAVPMPIQVRTRKYDDAFWRDMGHMSQEDKKAKSLKDLADLGWTQPREK